MQNIFKAIDIKYNLGILEEPLVLSGGFIHKMYQVTTKQRKYAIKLLNPYIMKRSDAMMNYANAERLERLLEAKHLPILPALSFGGKKMQELNGQYFYLFEFYDGKPLARKNIRPYHCRKMGEALANIHCLDLKASDEKYSEMKIDWEFYLAEVKKVNQEIYGLLKDNINLIIESQHHGNEAKKKLPKISAICHNDMDPKNVLWKNQAYRIIDLECLAYSQPMLELFEMALCWSGYAECQIDFQLFEAFLQGYIEANGSIPTDWQVLYDCNNNRLEWLEYNLKRVLGIDCTEDERELGIAQVKATLKQIVYYAKMQEEILKCCSQITLGKES